MVIPSWCQIHWLYYCHGSSYLLCYLELLATPVIRHVFSHRMTGMRTIPGPDGEQHCRALWYSFIKKKKRFIKSTVTKKIITLRLSKQTLYYYVSSIVLGGEIQGKGNTYFLFSRMLESSEEIKCEQMREWSTVEKPFNRASRDHARDAYSITF